MKGPIKGRPPSRGYGTLSPQLARLLEEVERTGSLNAASRAMGASYRHQWGLIKRAEAELGSPLVESDTGGEGGGGTRLTPFGKRLLDSHKLHKDAIETLTENEEFWQVISTKLSARNQLSGKIVSIEKDGVAAKIKIEITTPTVITSMITSEAAEFLELEEGDEVQAVVKATEVMVMK